MEGLSTSISNAVNEGVVHGAQICPTAPTVSHLLFADDSFLFFRADVSEVAVVKSLLHNYEMLSGQSVNFQKSGIHFSANVKRARRRDISNILGVFNGLSNSKYLGLPSLVGRSKKKVFEFVKEKVWRKVQGWRAKKVSQAGKTILIKNGAQSIPTYYMSCFLLPKSLCQEIEKIMNKFWWCSNTDRSKGINWLPWADLSASKCKGGIGFRSLYGFNIDLIGKQCWKFLKDPSSLVARLYKAKYFPDNHFLEARKQAGASYIWTCMMTALNVLKKGFRWIVSNGQSINALRDPWLKDKVGFCVDQDRSYGGEETRVSDLFVDNSRMWDAQKVLELFSSEHASMILATRVHNSVAEDRVVWAVSTDGHYSVKAGYQFWCNSSLITSGVRQSEGWGRLWRLDVPHKVRTFLWRFC